MCGWCPSVSVVRCVCVMCGWCPSVSVVRMKRCGCVIEDEEVMCGWYPSVSVVRCDCCEIVTCILLEGCWRSKCREQHGNRQWC